MKLRKKEAKMSYGFVRRQNRLRGRLSCIAYGLNSSKVLKSLPSYGCPKRDNTPTHFHKEYWVASLYATQYHLTASIVSNSIGFSSKMLQFIEDMGSM